MKLENFPRLRATLKLDESSQISPKFSTCVDPPKSRKKFRESLIQGKASGVVGAVPIREEY